MRKHGKCPGLREKKKAKEIGQQQNHALAPTRTLTRSIHLFPSLRHFALKTDERNQATSTPSPTMQIHRHPNTQPQHKNFTTQTHTPGLDRDWPPCASPKGRTWASSPMERKPYLRRDPTRGQGCVSAASRRAEWNNTSVPQEKCSIVLMGTE